MTYYLVNFIKGNSSISIKIQADTKEEAQKIGTSMCNKATIVIGYKVKGEPKKLVNFHQDSSGQKSN